MTEEEQKKVDEELRAEMLADTVGDPPLEVQLKLLQDQFQMWTNTYFASKTNYALAHESGLSQEEANFFSQAKQYRAVVKKLEAKIEKLKKKIGEEKGKPEWVE